MFVPFINFATSITDHNRLLSWVFCVQFISIVSPFLLFPCLNLPLNPRSHCVCVGVFFPGAEVREVDLKAVTGGIVHTKLWVVDQKHFYLGSANMDWRSLSQVKRREREMCIFRCICISGGHGIRHSSHYFHPTWPFAKTLLKLFTTDRMHCPV